MDIKQLDERFSVTAQLVLTIVDNLANAGFRTIIASRARNERTTSLYPNPEKQGRSLGMRGYEILSRTPESTPLRISKAFASALQSSTTPVLGYCRNRKRAIHLWAYAKAAHYPIADHAQPKASGLWPLWIWKPLAGTILRLYRNRMGQK